MRTVGLMLVGTLIYNASKLDSKAAVFFFFFSLLKTTNKLCPSFTKANKNLQFPILQTPHDESRKP